MEVKRIGVVGCGLMGSGIAEVCAKSGYSTIVLEVNQQFLDKGMNSIKASLEKAASKGKITHIDRIGLVGALQFTKPGTTEPAPDPAWHMVWESIKRGVMLFAPVGVGGSAIKINPPLIITEDAMLEGLGVMEEVAKTL